jgi:hypothetical protein
MPVLAARLADVGVVDTHPLVGGRVGEHRLDQLAVLLLHVADVVEPEPDVFDSRRQTVTHPLELVDGEQPGAAQTGNREVDALAREGRAEEAPQLQLQGRDLAPKVGPGGALIMFVESGV